MIINYQTLRPGLYSIPLTKGGTDKTIDSTTTLDIEIIFSLGIP